jgi:rhamnose transport system ATP-binding protein
MSELRLEAVGVTKTYGAVRALRDVHLSIASGEIHALVGENGAGKSTLIKILSGAVPRDGGTLTLNGEDYQPTDPQHALRAGVGTVYQDPQIIPSLNVTENVFLGRFTTNSLGVVKRREMVSATRKLLETFEINLDPLGPCDNLSVADMQMLQIARAASFSALQLLILDEPTSTLTPNEVRRLFSVVDRLRAEGTSVLFVSHKLDEVTEHADAVTVFRDGAYVTDYRRGEYTADDLVRGMVGRDLDPIEPKSSETAETSPALSVRGLTGGRFEDVSFDVYPGEILGVFGLVGAGRTDVLRAIFGADRLEYGTIELWGKHYKPRTVGAAITEGLALVPEDRRGQGLVQTMSVDENLNLTTMHKHSKAGLLSRSSLLGTTTEYISRLGIKTAGPGALVTSLSGGNQQKVVIARWLASNPKLLMLDEPAAGVDIGAKNELYHLIDQVAESGVPVIVVSSELPEILRLCNRVAVMREGRLECIVLREDATEEYLLSLATVGLKEAVSA